MKYGWAMPNEGEEDNGHCLERKILHSVHFRNANFMLIEIIRKKDNGFVFYSVTDIFLGLSQSLAFVGKGLKPLVQ
jgi:hypothetical protein